MIEQSITYKDYNGDTRTEVFSFHIDKADMVEMEANSPGGVKEYYNRLLREKDNAKIYATFKEILLKSIGKRSEDGRRFIRDQETRDEFTQTNAFGDFILTLGNDAELAAKFMQSFSTNAWNQFRKYVKNISDNSHQLDENLTFSNTEVKKGDYVSRRLPYRLERGDCRAWDELIGTLYSVEERAKIEWAIGAIVSGDAKKIQKFLVLYGPAGTGKSTVLNIVEKLFEGYTATFEAKALAGRTNDFATEVFKSNPLVAIQHDGDLSRIEDNTKLNSIISHENMVEVGQSEEASKDVA